MNIERRLERIESLLLLLISQDSNCDLEEELAKEKAKVELMKTRRRK